MAMKQQTMQKKSIVKLALSGLSLSALLMLSACSGGDNKAAEEPAAVNEPETVIVEPEAPVEAEPVVEAETTEVPEVEAEEVSTDAAAEPEVLAADAGAVLYEKQCKVCHEKGLLAAPVFGDKEAWTPRIAQGIDTLHMHSAKGFNKMPAQANAEVSEAQVHAAVDYMVAAAS